MNAGVGAAIRGTLFYGTHIIRRDGLLSAVREAAHLERMPIACREAVVDRRLGAILSYARTHVPHYRDVLPSSAIPAGGPALREWLASAPLLTKSIALAAGDRMLSDELAAIPHGPDSTSGSTGESFRFIQDHRDMRRMAGMFRGMVWSGASPFDRHATLWGVDRDRPVMMSAMDRLRAWLRPNLFLSSYHLDDPGLDRCLSELIEWQPRLLVGYSSPLACLAEHVARTGRRVSSLGAIISSAEQLLPFQRECIQAAFGVPVFNRYGSREFACIAHECERHDGLHIHEGALHVEIINEAGAPCPPGVVGEIAITALFNHAMPFIRYRTGDLGSLAGEPCACGRTLSRLTDLQGRILDLVRTRSGQRIGGTFWTLLVRRISRRILQFQLRQPDIDHIGISMKMEGASALSAGEEEALRAEIGRVAPDLAVELVYVDDIPLTSSGKRRFVVSMLRDAQS